MPIGYKSILQKGHPHANSGGHVLEHIVVAEKKLGRMLRDGETVHHIDKNKQNNSPDNLMVFASRGDHTSFHGGCEIYKDGDVWRAVQAIKKCPACGKEFVVSVTRIKKYNAHYCSNKCKMEFETKIRSVQEIIDALHETNGNFRRASESLGVTDNALKHRLKNAGLPYLSKDYKAK